ncbi:MAG: hypothetical protein Q9170_008328 [Blastenia crenularia]
MLNCKACIRRCIHTIFADVLHDSRESRLQQQLASGFRRGLSPASKRRGYRSAASPWSSSYTKSAQRANIFTTRRQTTQATERVEGLSLPPLFPPRYGGHEKTNSWDVETHKVQAERREGAKPRDLIRKHGSDKHAGHDRPGTIRKTKDFDLEPRRRLQLGKELLYLQDPLKLAENTIGLLRNDDDEKALEIVRMASKRSSCTVSWNHIIDYNMAKGRVQQAVKIYNEMKKRAQQPDAQTYTILLRGLSWHPHQEQSLPRALKIYHSMFAENCPVKPNIIHTNTILKVCALAKDMDALWGVAAKLPTRGIGASNNLTFTIILNAIRTVAFLTDKDLPDEDWEQKSLRQQRAVMQGRRIWEEIIPRWRAGDIWIDEELVCAMGRLLLLGSTERDYDDVLSLAEQVMAIRRQKRSSPEPEELNDARGRPVTAPEDGGNEASMPADHAQDDAAFAADNLVSPEDDVEPILPQDQSSSPTSSTLNPILTPALANVFRSEPQPKAPSTSIARPGRNTLSLLLDACISLRAIHAAQRYWGLLTDPSGPYNIEPDSENYHMYLRFLRLKRASKVAAELIKDLHYGELKHMKILQPKTFRIAMSCCGRDKNNVHALSHGQAVVEVMYKALPQPDVKTMEWFMQLLASGARLDFRLALPALRTLETGMRLLANHGAMGLRGREEERVDKGFRKEVQEFGRKVVGCCDFVQDVAGDRLEREERAWVREFKAKWSIWLRRKKMVGRVKWVDVDAGEGEGDEEKRVGGGQGNESRPLGERQGLERKVVSRRWKPTTMVGGRRKRMERAQTEMRRSGEFDFYDGEQ